MKRVRCLCMSGLAALSVSLVAMSPDHAPSGAESIPDFRLALIRGADEKYHQYNANSCEANGVAAAGANVVAASTGCNANNSVPPTQASCAKCDLGSTGSQGIGQYTVDAGTGVTQSNPSCGLLLKGTCMIIYGPPATYSCENMGHVPGPGGVGWVACGPIWLSKFQPVPPN